MKTQGKFLVPQESDVSPVFVIDAGSDPESRAVAFQLLADQAKGDIRRLANGRWEASIPVPSPDGNGNEIRCFARTRRDVESTIDDIIAMLVDFGEDGTIRNADAKSEEIQ